jgi:pyruvate dehydrogenase E1 component beta subunit
MGIGLGCSLKGIPSLYLMKQHDFALLGFDQLVNTYNLIRRKRMKAPFVVGMVVVDSGFEGPQSNLNNLDDFASITKANVHIMSTFEKINELKRGDLTNDLHFLAISQKNLKEQISQQLAKHVTQNSYFNVYRFEQNVFNNVDSLLIYSGVSSFFNTNFIDDFSRLGIDVAILHKIDSQIKNIDLNFINKYKNIFIYSTSKSLNNSLEFMHSELLKLGKKVEMQTQKSTLNWTQVNSDEFTLNFQQLKDFIQTSKRVNT